MTWWPTPLWLSCWASIRVPHPLKVSSSVLPDRGLLSDQFTDAVTSHSHSHTHGEEKKALVSTTEADTKLMRPHPHAVKAHAHRAEEAAVLRMERITMFLEAHFGDVQLRAPEPAADDIKIEGEEEAPSVAQGPAIVITLDESQAEISLLDMVSHFVGVYRHSLQATLY